MTLSRREALKYTLSTTAFAALGAAGATAGTLKACADGRKMTQVNVKDYGAKGDGKTDDTAAIHSARDTIGFGGKVFFPAGTYLVSGLTASVANQAWELSYGAVVKMKTGATEILNIAGADVSVVGGVFDGSNGTAHDWSQQGIRVSADGSTIRKVTVKNSPKHGVYVLNQSRITITGCVFKDNTDHGVFVQNNLTAPSEISDIVITDNLVDASSAAVNTSNCNGITVKADTVAGLATGVNNTRSAARVTISRNTVRLPYNTLPGTFQSGLGLSSCRDFLVNDNVIIGGWSTISTGYNLRGTFANNVLRGFFSVGLELVHYQNGVTVTGNVFDNDGAGTSAGAAGIRFSDDRGAGTGPVTNLTISGNSFYGWAVAGSAGVGGSAGIAFSSGSSPNGVTISANTFTSAVASGQFSGIWSNVTLRNLAITGNIFDAASTNGSYGILFLGTTTGLVVTGNQFSDIAATALHLSTSAGGTFSDVRFTGNVVRNCGAAIGGDGAAAGTNIIYSE